MRRMSLGMSQEKLGAAIGITFQQVQKYEKGTNRIGASRLLQIAGVLEVSIEYFFQGLPQAGSGEPTKSEPMLEFLTSPDSERLVRHFVQLRDDAARRKVTDLVEWLASATAEAHKGRV
jgi:transcriptional regulator with XRE-family HTH domain